ncbi:MAG: LytTR family DNA-binding domain-containing protein [Kofleriaceae bacterium]
MKVVVVEDEPAAARMVVELLARVAPDAAVVAQLASVAALTRWLAAQPPPDLILADIELQDGRVFDALATAVQLPPIIFTTAYDHFLLDAFRTQGSAYLMKPLHEADLAGALAKYEDLRRAYAAHNPLAQLVPVSPAATPYRRHFTVSVARKIHVVALDRVALVRLGLAGVEVVDRDGTALSVTGTASLGELEASLPPLQFFRINRTEIVALDAIEHVEPRKDRLGLAVRGVAGAVTVSTHRTPAFRRWIGLT